MTSRFALLTRRLRPRARRHFITGLLVIVPLWITWYVLAGLVERIDGVLAILPARFHPDTYLPFRVPGLGLIFTLIIIQVVGILSANLIGRTFVSSFEGLLGRIPFVRGLYLAIKQFLEHLVTIDAERFRRVVLVRYPGAGLCRIGLVTGERTWEEPGGRTRKMLHLFLPNSPNVATGLFFIAPEEDVIPTDLTPDQAFKLLMSGGMVGSDRGKTPDEKP